MQRCMSSGRSRLLHLAALGFAVLILLPKSSDAHDAEPEQTLELDVIVNGYPVNEIGEFQERGGKLFVTMNELDSLGFVVRPGQSASAYVSLALVPDLAYRLDDQTQTIFITAADRALKPTLLQAEGDPDDQDVHVESGLGADLNYDVVDTYTEERTVAEASLDGHAFSPWGLLSASATGTAGAYSDLPPVVRLNTTYSFADVDMMRQYAVGDFIGGGLNWSRPVRMAGIQIGSDFGVRPDLVTFPVPTIEGQVAVPSTVDVLVNGVQLLSQDVPSGPFQINQLPVVTGVGSVSVVTRNAAGQQSTETLPFYSSGLLLKAGLAAYSAEIGAVRLNYGLLSDDYRAPVGALTYRYGLTDWLTLEGHAEATSGNDDDGGYDIGMGGMGGGGAALTIGHYAVASVDAATSSFGGRNGALLSASLERMSPRISFSSSIQLADKNFSDVAAAYGQPFPSLQARFSFGLALPRLGSLGIAFVEVRQAQNRQVESLPYTGQTGTGLGFGLNLLSVIPATHTSLLSASFSRGLFDGAYAYATAFDDLSNANSAGVMAGVSFAFGDRGSVEAGGGGGASGSNQTLQAMQSANNIGDFGWQVLEGAGGQSQQLVSGSYKSPYGLVDVGVDRDDGQTAYRGDVQGSIAVADGNIFAANTIYDSFAVVDTDRTKGIEVLQENRPIGKTGASGLMLVPDLTSFDVNRLGIDPNDVPLDAQMGNTTQLVRPQDHSGVVVHFSIHPSHGALLHLVDGHGGFVAVGSTCQVIKPSLGDEVTVGYDGEAYLTGLGAHDTALITLPDGDSCVAKFRYKASSGSIPEIGPVPCIGTAP